MANFDAVKKEGIVLRKTELGEADCMVSCIGEEGKFSFYAKGIRKTTSKNAPSLNELTLSEFTLLLRPGGDANYLLKEASGRKNYMKDGDFDAIAVENFLCELTSRAYNEEEGEGKEFYPYLKAALEAINDGFDPLTVGFLCFATTLRLIGFGLEVDNCVRCLGKKGIIGVNYPDGGFICSSCFEGDFDEKLDAYSLKVLRFAFRYKPEDMRRVVFPKESIRPLFHSLEEYFREGLGYSLKTLQFLLSYAF